LLTLSLTLGTWSAWGQSKLPSTDAKRRLEQARTLRQSAKPVQWAQSIQVLQDFTTPDPTTEYLRLYNLGLAYEQQGDYNRSLRYLSDAKAFREQKKVPEYSIYNTLGWLYLLKNDYANALLTFNNGLPYQTQMTAYTRTRFYNNLGFTYLKLGLYRPASDYFTKSLQVDAGNRSAKQNLSIAQKLLQSGKSAKAG
jgi:tetratricopeptide (TPR) repeat protein